MTDQGQVAGLREEAIVLLQQEGYEPIDAPFKVGRVDFQMDGLFAGPAGTLSLALVLDGPTSREEAGKLYWLTQRLVRALDAEGSRRSVTVVLVGGNPDDRSVVEMQAIARVLLLDGSLPTNRMLAPLMRLRTRQTAPTLSNGLDLLARYLDGRPQAAGLTSLLEAAPQGKDAVENSLQHWIDLAVGRRQ